LVLMGEVEPASVDAIVTDPPYGLQFMGKEWDHGVPGVPFWLAGLQVLKPGGHLVAFGGTRTFHRLTCAIEDAGFEIRDCLSWLYGSGFPKSLDVSKAIDKAAGAEREIAGTKHGRPGYSLAPGKGRTTMNSARDGSLNDSESECSITAPATDAAREWDGWGTALKPAHEPVVLARKPLDMAADVAILVPTIQGALCAVATFAKTDTPSSEPLRASGFLSIVSSLSKSLDDLSRQANRLTTATAFALITDLRILSCSLSRLTHAITTGDERETSGVASDAWLVGGISRSVLAKCERLTFTTADELAIGLHADEASVLEGSRLSPDWCPIVLARKPLAGTVAANVLEHGTGALNVDGCRIGSEARINQPMGRPEKCYGGYGATATATATAGRWPANVCLDEEAAAELDAQTGNLQSGTAVGGLHRRSNKTANCYGEFKGRRTEGDVCFGDSGGASRFFYTAKASKGERHYAGKNTHPTVKPVDLMRWLCRLITPPGGLVLDPFMGSGSTGVAALGEGFRFIGFDNDAESVAIARRRIAGPLFAEAPA